MTDIEKAIQEFKEYEISGWCTSHIPLTGSRLQAIQALHEKAERDKECEYCSCIKSSGIALNAELKKLCLVGSNTELDEEVYLSPKFCFMCGRKLTSAPTDER